MIKAKLNLPQQKSIEYILEEEWKSCVDNVFSVMVGEQEMIIIN